MNTAEKNLEELIATLAGPNQNAAASASADLAAMIWAARIKESTIIAWLTGSDENLRRTASWAVWDLGGPAEALSKLMELGPNEENDSVRLYCLRALIDHHPEGQRRQARIRRFVDDKLTAIRDRAMRAIEPDED